MMWNGGKFVGIRLGPLANIREETMLFTPDMEEPITIQEHTRDLGVLVNSNADFRPQRMAVIKKVKDLQDTRAWAHAHSVEDHNPATPGLRIPAMVPGWSAGGGPPALQLSTWGS